MKVDYHNFLQKHQRQYKRKGDIERSIIVNDYLEFRIFHCKNISNNEVGT